MSKATQVGSPHLNDSASGFAAACCGPQCKSSGFRAWGTYCDDLTGQSVFACCEQCGTAYYEQRTKVRFGPIEGRRPTSLAEVINLLQQPMAA